MGYVTDGVQPSLVTQVLSFGVALMDPWVHLDFQMVVMAESTFYQLSGYEATTRFSDSDLTMIIQAFCNLKPSLLQCILCRDVPENYLEAAAGAEDSGQTSEGIGSPGAYNSSAPTSVVALYSFPDAILGASFGL